MNKSERSLLSSKLELDLLVDSGKYLRMPLFEFHRIKTNPPPSSFL